MGNRVIVSVINDLTSDQRVDRTCTTLFDMGYDVLLVGRKLKRSVSLNPRVYKMTRMSLLFENKRIGFGHKTIRQQPVR